MNTPQIGQVKPSTEYVIYAEGEGVISEHESESDAMKAFAEYLKGHPGPVKAEPVLFRRAWNRWVLF